MRLFNTLVPGSVLALLISETVLAASCYMAAAVYLLDLDPIVWLMYDNGALRVAVVVASVLIGLYFQDLYESLMVPSRTLLFQQFSLALGIAFLLQAMAGYITPLLVLPRWIMMAGSLAVLVVLPAWRVLYAGVVVKAMGARRVLFLGCSPLVRRIAAEILARPELGLAIAGFVRESDEDAEMEGLPMLGGLQDFRRVVNDLKPDVVVVGLAERRRRMPVHELLDVRFSGISILDAAIAYESVFKRVCVEQVRPSQLIFSSELGPRPVTVKLQSLYSFAIALTACVLLLPVLLLVALLVKVTSPGPVLYRQRRVGKNDKTFTVYKFRSMRADAEKNTGAVWASRNDPRVTPLGRWLRLLRLDELPQLFNVLRGEMSIVGPRPERPEFVTTLSEQIPFYRQRHCLKPGVTGWAQINHKYGDTIEDTIAKLEYDLYYIKNLSPSLDFYIIFNTLKVMLLLKGSQ